MGIRSHHGGTSLSELNNGKGVRFEEGQDDIRVIAKNGWTVDVNIDGAETIQDVIDAINAAALATGVSITADLAPVGNGIRITDTTGGLGVMSVERLNFSLASDDLGLFKTADPAATELISDDTNTVKVDSVFTALIELHDALTAGDEQAITAAGERINAFVNQAARVHGIVGAILQSEAPGGDAPAVASLVEGQDAKVL